MIHDFVPEVNAPQPHAINIDIPVENLDVQNNEPEQEDPIVENEIQAPEQPQPQPVVIPNEPVRRSQRERRSASPDCYETYLSEDLYDVGKVDDPISYKQAIAHQNSDKWIEAMQDELKSMSTNQVYELVEIPNGVKPVGCKWVYKTKRDSKGKVEKFKARLVAKGFTQVEGVDYNETFSPVSTKDSFRIIMRL
jgi:hypothetical protein